MRATDENLPTDRRAFFVAPQRPMGGAADLLVYTFWGKNDRIQQDLRHELAHALLHSGLREVPMWLDEGLAANFALPAAARGVNAAPREGLRRGGQDGAGAPALTGGVGYPGGERAGGHPAALGAERTPMTRLVTAGNTQVPIDKVRYSTNIFSGRTGASIALEAHRRGHDVTLLTSHPEVIPELGAGTHLAMRWHLFPYRTFDEFQPLMR